MIDYDSSLYVGEIYSPNTSPLSEVLPQFVDVILRNKCGVRLPKVDEIFVSTRGKVTEVKLGIKIHIYYIGHRQ